MSIGVIGKKVGMTSVFAEDGTMDKADYVRCLELARAASHAGPYTLIYDGPNGDEWAGLDAERAIVLPYL